MNRIKLIFTLCILSTFICKAQTSSKIYSTSATNNFLRANSPLSSLSFAFSKTNAKKRYQEIELGTFAVSNLRNVYYNDSGLMVTSYSSKFRHIKLRYERGQTILQAKFKRKEWKFLLAHAAQLSFEKSNLTPQQTNIFETEIKSINISYHIIPKINVQLSKRLILDVNTPIFLYKIGGLSQFVNNPNLPINQRKWTVLNVDAFGNGNLLPINLRVGLGYTLGKK